MNLLLLLYAMIAGLAGFNAGPSAGARMAAVAEHGAFAEGAAPAQQASIAVRALVARATQSVTLIPVAKPADARRIALVLPTQALPFAGRAAPERRRE